MSSLLERTLGGIRDQGESGNRRTSGGGAAGSRNSPYSRPEGAWAHDKYSNKEQAPADSGRPRAARQQEGKSAKLAISNVHYEVSERELELLFVQIGPIASGPKIRFDKSGRSTGLAWVTFSDEEHAAQAKEAFDGALAKGQEIKVDFDYRLDARAERGAPAPGTLLARLEADNSRPSGRDRDQRPPRDAPRGPRLSTERGVGGAGRGADRGAARGAGRGGRGGARGGREPRAPREPKTTDDLDAELEAFMAAPAPAKPAAAAAPASADVEMS